MGGVSLLLRDFFGLQSLLPLLVVFGLLILIYARFVNAENRLRRRLVDVRLNPPQLIDEWKDEPSPDWWELRVSPALKRSGIELSTNEYTTMVVLSAIAMGLSLFIIRSHVLALALGLLIGLIIPFIILEFLRQRRLRKLQKQTPEALFLLARAMRSGSGLTRSLELCTDQTVYPMKRELSRMLGHVELGLSVASALSLMGERVGLEDIDMLVAGVELHEESGGDLTRLIDTIATGARARNEFRMQVHAATALSRASAAFISAAQPLIIMIYALSPQSHLLKSFINAPQGQVALSISIALEVIGVLWLWAILRIKP